MILNVPCFKERHAIVTVILFFIFIFRDPSWRNEESHTERSRTGSESSQHGSTSGRGEILMHFFERNLVCPINMKRPFSALHNCIFTFFLFSYKTFSINTQLFFIKWSLFCHSGTQVGQKYCLFSALGLTFNMFSLYSKNTLTHYAPRLFHQGPGVETVSALGRMRFSVGGKVIPPPQGLPHGPPLPAHLRSHWRWCLHLLPRRMPGPKEVQPPQLLVKVKEDLQSLLCPQVVQLLPSSGKNTVHMMYVRKCL